MARRAAEATGIRVAVLSRIPLLKWLSRRRLRRVLRGYRYLRDSNQLDRIASVKSSLTDVRIMASEGRVSKLIFGAAEDDAERVIRQYLLRRLAGSGLTNALLHALGRPGAQVVHPLPWEWRQVVRERGFEVAELRSAFMWAGYLVLIFGYGVLSIARRTISNLKELLLPSIEPLGKFVYFEALSAGSLPQPGTEGRSHDVVTWYQQWDGRVHELDALCHSVVGVDRRSSQGVSVIRIPSAVLPLTGFVRLLRFVGASVAATALAAIDLARGRWWHALLLSEAASAIQMRLQHRDRVACEFLLHNSNWIYRPLWTYEAMAHGSQITFYFYSTNVQPFQRENGEAELPYGWRTMNWPRYLVWDNYLADFVRRAVGLGADIMIVGPIWFTTSKEMMPMVGPRAISVFDVAPFRSSKHAGFGPVLEYYVPATSLAFLQHSHQAAQECGYTMLWKRKRKIGSMAHVQYRLLAEHLGNAEGVTIVNPDISAVRVIELSQLVISMPFTSTALIARDMDKPSCYYDPTGLLHLNDPAAHGIPIVQGLESLVAWIRGQSIVESAHSHVVIGHDVVQRT